MTEKPLNIALTFDAEMDAFDSSIVSVDMLEWRGIEKGLPLIETVLDSVIDSYGNRACATWFVRCDDQIGHLTGNPAYLLEHYRDQWNKRQQMGDEIAFHPHLYRQVSGKWSQDTDPVSLREQLIRSLDAMKSAGFTSIVSRIGEAFSSNAVMNSLEECGIRCDSTALPGRARIDSERNLDWRGTPTQPYHPSLSDYRQPGKCAHGLIEVPMSMLMTRADYDTAPMMRYLDLSFHPQALRDGMADLVKDAETIVTVTHPSTILPSAQQHGLLSFSSEAFAQNLHLLLKECLLQERLIRFITLRDCI